MALLSFYMESLGSGVGSALDQKQSTVAAAPLQGVTSSKEADICRPLEGPIFWRFKLSTSIWFCPCSDKKASNFIHSFKPW